MEKIVTAEDIKVRRKESIRTEHFLFRVMIYLGIISYKVTYNNFYGYRKTFKARAWHPLTWVFIVFIVIFSIPGIILESFKELKEEFKEKTYFC